MADFLDDISVYNAKAAAAISLAVTQGNSPRANLMSSLKTTANDITLTDDVRLEALTALINIGSLLDIPLPPYFPVATSYADSQTYVGVHNDLSGLNVGDFQHLTAAEKAAALNKASLSDISFANLIGVYTDNASLVTGFATKQNALNGTGYVKASGGTITYDNSTFLTTITGIVAAATPGGGQITGTYASPVISNAAVIAKVLTGFNGSASTGTITSSDSILSAIEKLNANVDNVIATSGTINNITFALPSAVFSYTAGPFTSGAAPLSASFVNQAQNRFFAGPSSGGSGQPSFRAIVAGDFPVSGATAGTYGSSTTVPQITVDAYGRVTNIASVASATGGQVNTITYSVPAGVFNSSVTGTTAVSITLGLLTQTANYVWAGPVSGAAAGPTFRALVAADIPSGLPISTISGLQSQLDNKLNNSLNDGEIFIGSIANGPAMKTLDGDITMTREGFVTISGESVTFSKMQEITSGTLLGRWGAATPGPVQEVGLSADFVLDSGTGILSLAVPVAPILDTKGSLITYTSATGTQVQLYAGTNGQILIPNNTLDEGLEWVSMSGDVELDISTPSGAATITAGAVTLAKMADLPTDTIIGNNAALGIPLALSVTDVTAMLDQFTTSAKGLVPAASFTPASGKTLADYFLNANGAWSLGGGGSGSGTVGNGSQYQLAYYNGAGTTTSVIGWTAPVANRALISNANGLPTESATTATELGYVSGVSSAIQTQINGKEPTITTLSLAKGGTNANNTAVNGGIAYSTASAINITAAGTSGQILKSNGAAAPTWTTATYPSTTVKDKILVSTANNVVGEIDAPVANNTFLKWDTGVFSWSAAGTGTVTTTGSPTSGNMAKFSGATSITNATAATDYVAPGVITSSGLTMSTTRLLGRTTASTGVIEEISLTTTGTSGAATLSGGVLNIPQYSGGSGSGTVNSATLGAIAYYAATGTAVSGTTNLYVDNTNGRINIGAFTAPSARVQISAGTATVPQMVLSPSTALTFSGTVNGSLWYDTASSNSSLTLYKDSGYTKLITKDRNPDFATTGSGILVSDNNGTLTKSAELTALGVLATYSTYTVTTTATNIFSTVSFTGSTGLPANFFATGKTIVVVVTGQYTSTSGSPTLPLTLAFGTYSQAFTINLHGGVTTASLWEAKIIITCSASGASGALRTMAQAIAIDDSTNGTPKFSKLLIQTASSFNTTSASTISLSASYVSPATTATIDMCQIYYLN